jgi:hypothetical protein
MPSTFQVTGSTFHSQSLPIVCGNSGTYYFHCIDAADNDTETAESSTYTVESVPIISEPSGGATIVFGTGGGTITFR